jgi:cytochrome b involved in lipid metabolism
VYDISEYMDYHPGGVDRIKPFLGKDIESVFKQVGHTSAAYKIMAQLPIVGKIQGAENITQDVFSPKLKEKYEFDISKGHWW